MRACKWNALDHLVEESFEMGDVSFLHAKNMNQLIVCVKRCIEKALNERPRRWKKQCIYRIRPEYCQRALDKQVICKKRVPFVVMLSNRMEAYWLKTNSTQLGWKQMMLGKLLLTIPQPGWEDAHMKCFMSYFREDGTIVLLDLLQKCLPNFILDGRSIIHVTFKFPASPYMSG